MTHCKRSCSVLFCPGELYCDRSVSLHRFPLEIEQCKAWVQFTRNETLIALHEEFGPVGTRSHAICARHFAPECFIGGLTGMKKVRLTADAVPTIYFADPAKYDPPEGSNIRRKTMAEMEAAAELKNRELRTPRGKVLYKPQRPLDNSDGFYDFLFDEATIKRRQKRQQQEQEREQGKSARLRHSKAIQTDDPLPGGVGRTPMPSEASCRLCFSTEGLQLLCSGMDFVQNHWLNQIYACTGVLVLPKPALSVYLCESCTQTIENFYQYRAHVRRNNQTFMFHESSLARFNDSNNIQSTISSALHSYALPVKERAKRGPKRKPSEMKKTSVGQIPRPVISGTRRNKRARLEDSLANTSAEVVIVSVDEDAIGDEEVEISLGEFFCWQCEKSFPFPFELAKHALNVHGVSVANIQTHLELDELNTNILEAMAEQRRTSVA